ncbi:hypothetical protein H2199_003591 [Coniosporium tulheliwenetii]|uniref:Uncharacterized protein n=1 Tax=Coniosporium tulheliwenetii TaxID=3383036 RepID=A0ACC2ZBC7_9PEZI|nr:hypothetical protein H2199_003591 [Cladosporium sp. JES 115]
MRDNDVELLTVDVIDDDTVQEERPSQEETANVDEDIPPLEYARYYGLTNDYLAERPLDPAHPPSPSISVFEGVDTENAWTLELLQGFSTRECLTIDKDTAAFLRDVLTAPHMTEDVEAEAGRAKISNLKYELPLLRSDNEWDLRHFGTIDPADLSRIKLPRQQVNDEKDEGLSWPKKHLNLPTQYDARANAEKLEIPVGTLPYLQGALSDPYTPADELDLIAEEIKYQRNPALEPVTPPLLPLTPPHTPFIPSSPTGRLELLSDRTDPAVAELQTLEDAMMKQDAILPHHGMKEGTEDPMLIESDDIGQTYSPLRSIAELPSSSPLKRKFADLKVEGPLTPPTTLPSPAKKAKSASFSEMLHECIPDLPLAHADDADTPDSPGSFKAFFNEVIEPIAGKANRELEQEQLQEVDTTKRVDVPIMDFFLPKAPWLEYARQPHGKHRESDSELDAQKKLLARVKREDLQLMQPWHGISKIERALPWSPFPPQLGKVALDEKIDDDGALSPLISGVHMDGEIVESDALIWKPEGLRILNDTNDSDDELEPSSFVEAEDMQTLVKKRRFEMDEAVEALDSRTGSKHKPSAGESHTQRGAEAPTLRPRTGKATVEKILPPSDQKSNSGLLFGGFSASTALSNFIEIHSAVAKKPKITHDLPSRPKSGAKHEVQQADTVSAASVAPRSTPLQQQGIPPSPIPSPAILTNLQPCHFVASTTLLKLRHLLHHIEELYPAAILIERDFGTQSVGNAPPAEADLLCSPATAVLMTTLQKAKQRALPGQAAQSAGGLRERIAHVSERYERVLVLVSEDAGKPETAAEKRGAAAELRALDERDCEALASLAAFAAALSGDVSVLYVAGGEEKLARWTIGIMARFGVPGLELLQEETLWELFLRRAGLNAFAAQVVLAELKKPASTPPPQAHSSSVESTPSSNDGDFGVAAFVKMSADERMRRFEGLLGGRRVLRRVSGALDQRWVSASDGYVM